jgi:serine/threonine protein kinase
MVSGRFRIEKLIAKGGMGTVWVGSDLELDRLVAVKFMDPTFAENKDLRGRFTREAKAAARLRTKHVVEIHEYGVDGATPFIVMELLEGEDLHVHLKRTKRVSLETAASIVVQCCRALKMSGEANIVHRDLKPGNVFLSRDLDEIVVKVLDFGVAKLIDSETEVTRAGTMLGSPQYMSPEQAVGEPVDHRSDLWSLAAIIFRMLTGHIAFSGKSAGDIIIKLCTAALPVPSQVSPDLPKSIDTFFEKAFERDPDERFQTATELSAAFVAAVAGAEASDAAAFESLAKVDLPSGRGTLPSGDFSATPVSYSGTPVSGVLSPLTDPNAGAGSGPHELSAADLMNGPGSVSEPPTQITDVSTLEADVPSATPSDEGEDAPDPEEILKRVTAKASPHGVGAADVQVVHRGLPAIVWVLFIAAMAAGAFIAFFAMSKPETGSLLDSLNLKPAQLPSGSAAGSASSAPPTVIDPLMITPEPSAAPSASASASASAATVDSATRPPGYPPGVWPHPKGTEKPKEPQRVEKSPYD